MDTIKFSKISNPCTEQHNLEISNIAQVKIFGQEYAIYNPCNLNIFISNICPNHCDFCINKSYANQDVQDDIYFKALNETLKELSGKSMEITITGGEPTLRKNRFVKTMKLCSQYGFKPRTVSTTGQFLFSEYEEKPLCQHMIENGFTKNISISRMHYEDETNTQIMGPSNLTNEEIQKLALFFKINNADFRLSSNLIKGQIDSLDKMLSYLHFYDTIGVESVLFRQLVGNYENLIDVVFETIKLHDEFQYLGKMSGIFYDVDLYQYDDFLVKCYSTNKNVDRNIISSLSLRNGILRNSFSGTKLYKEFL